jgi:hypothetical protein
MIKGLEENRVATRRMLLGAEGTTLSGLPVNDAHQVRLAWLVDATLSKWPPANVAA